MVVKHFKKKQKKPQHSTTLRNSNCEGLGLNWSNMMATPRWYWENLASLPFPILCSNGDIQFVEPQI